MNPPPLKHDTAFDRNPHIPRYIPPHKRNHTEQPFNQWHSKFQDNVEPSTTTSSIFEGCGLSDTEIDNIITCVSAGHGNSGKHLRDEQHKALNAMKSQHNHVQVLEGPAGSGKTTTVVAMIKIAVRAGLNVLVISENNAAANKCCENLENAAKCEGIARDKAEYPLRLYTREDDLNDLKTLNGLMVENFRINDNVRTALTAEQIYDRSFDITRKRIRTMHQFLQPQASTANTTMYSALIGVPVGKYPPVSRRDAEKKRPLGLISPDQLDFNNAAHVEYLRLIGPGSWYNMLEEMNNFDKLCSAWQEATIEADGIHLKPTMDQLKKGRYATEFVFEDVIASRPIIVTTTNKCFNTLVRRGIAKGINPKKGLLIVVDDASSMSDASLRGLLTDMIPAQQIQQDFAGINPVKSVILVGDPKQLAPLKQDPRVARLYPESTLFKRLCDSSTLR